jgi:hypothetical protein
LVPDAVDLGARLDTLGAHVLFPVELQEDLRLALARTREHGFDTGERGKSFFDRARYQAFDFLGC